MEYKKVFKVSDFTDIKPTESDHKSILDWANERRPWDVSDSKKQTFFPDLSKVRC